MTREEAKHIVDVAFNVPQAIRRAGEDRTYHQDEISEAKNMAISALSENKGEWIHPYRSDIACECSVCHMQMPITDYFHYCPNCGARMKGSE